MEKSKKINKNYKNNSISYINMPLSINKKNQNIYNNLKKGEEEKNYGPISSSFIQNQVSDKNILISNNKNDNNISKNIDESNNEENNSSNNKNVDQKGTPEFKRNMYEKEEMLSNDLILDEINLKKDYEKIEKELSKYKRSNEYNENSNDNKMMDINSNKNEDDNTDSKNIPRNTLNMNSIIESDLFYYSDDEEDLSKKIKSNNEKIKKIQENINKLDQEDIPNIDINNNINNIEKLNIKNMEANKKIIGQKENSIVNNDSKKDLDEKFLENIEYGIDETGNPIDAKNYKEEISQNSNYKIKKIIAYIIISKEKGKNHLIDLKGNIIPKREDGDFYYNYNGVNIIIKNFDVQNPKLRVFGARKRYSSIFYDDDIVPQGSKQKNQISPGDKKIMLFNQIKNNIYYENKNLFKNNRQSPMINRKNYREKILNVNINKKAKEQSLNMSLNKHNKNEENKRIFHYNKNKKDFIYRKTPLEKMKDLDVINLSQNIEKNVDSIKRTNIILNNNELRNSQNNKINPNLINIFMNNKGYGNLTWRNNRTPSPLKKEMISVPQELNDKTKVAQHKIYKLKKEIEIYNNNNNVLNISSMNVNINNNSIIKRNKNNHPFKYSSSFIKNNSINKKINPFQKKSQSIKNNLDETINNISNSKKQIKYNSNNTMQKNNKSFINKNREFLSSINSKRNIINGNYYNYKAYNNKIGILNNSNIIYNSTNEENKLNLKKIELNKKFKIATSPNRSFKCSVLSKEANEVITDYSNSRKNINKKVIQKINLQECNKINENECKNKTILIKYKFYKKLDGFSKKKLNNSYDSKQIGKTKLVFNIKNKNMEIKQKNKAENNKNNDMAEFQKNMLLNKMIKNSKIKKKYNKMQIYNQSYHFFDKEIKSNSVANIFNIKNKFVNPKINIRVPNKINLNYKSNSFYFYK